MKQQTALNILKSGENVFLTGSAGAGKTYTLNQYIQYLHEHRIPVAVTASTGIAATHMNGMTIHSWAGIGIKNELSDSALERLAARQYLRERIEKTQVLIIDEISMLHKKQFDLVNTVLKYIKKDERAFGGLQIIVCGDFFQLPPVGDKDERNRDKFAFMSEAWLEAQFRICYLTEQFRQSDAMLDQLLNAIRAQNVQQSQIDHLLQYRYNSRQDIVTRLFTHNADVDVINQQQLAQLDGDEYPFQALCAGNDKMIDVLKSSVRAPELLILKKHAKVIFVKNNFDSGYVNGSMGEVVDFIQDEEHGLLPQVKLTDGTLIDVSPETWSIDIEEDDDEVNVLASYTQIPLRLAWAITIHKSQGMTLDSAKIDLSKTFEKGQGYVALSRLKSLDGLHLLGFHLPALELDRLAFKADKRFQELSLDVEQQSLNSDFDQLHRQFIVRCGGELEAKPIKTSKKGVKGSSIEETKQLFTQGLDIEDIARERRITKSTVIDHLKLLAKEQQLDVERIKPDEALLTAVRKVYKKIQKRNDPKDFTDGGVIRLRSIVEEGGFSYEQVRLALIFIE